MNTFAIIRRSLWGGILSICIVVSILYLSIASVFLSTSSLKTIASSAGVAKTIRDDRLLPNVLTSVKTSQYSALLDTMTVTQAFNNAVSPNDLNQKLAPAIDATQAWLNSKQPNITFSMDISKLSDRFTTTLSQAVSTKLLALPRCSPSNTPEELQNGTCRSPFSSQSVMTTTVTQAIKNQSLLKDTTITQDTVPRTASLQRTVPDLPSYLNILYGLSIIAAGLIVLVGLWLLIRHRLAGVVTIGAACVIAAVVLYVMTLLLPVVAGRFDNDTLSKSLVKASSDAFKAVLQHNAALLGIGGMIAIVIATIAIIVLARRRKPHKSMHFSSQD